MSAALNSCAIEIARRIENQATERPEAVSIVRVEIVQHPLGPFPIRLGHQLIYRPAAVSVAARSAIVGRAIEIACGVKDWGGVQTSAIISATKTVQHLFGPVTACLRRQLEHRADVVGSTVGRCAVEIASGVNDEAGIRGESIFAVVIKVVQHYFFRCRPNGYRNESQSKNSRYRLYCNGPNVSHG